MASSVVSEATEFNSSPGYLLLAWTGKFSANSKEASLDCTVLSRKTSFIKSRGADWEQMNKSYLDLTAVEVAYSLVSSSRTKDFVGSSRVCAIPWKKITLKLCAELINHTVALQKTNASRKNCLLLNENRLKLS